MALAKVGTKSVQARLRARATARVRRSSATSSSSKRPVVAAMVRRRTKPTDRFSKTIRLPAKAGIRPMQNSGTNRFVSPTSPDVGPQSLLEVDGIPASAVMTEYLISVWRVFYRFLNTKSHTS